jgi:hypothetical protein
LTSDLANRPVCRHRKSPSEDGIITGSFELVIALLDVPKESLHAPANRHMDESYMALTFGTLLSSQGADAHRHDPFGPIGGNPRNVTRSGALGQTRPALPRPPGHGGPGRSKNAWSVLGRWSARRSGRQPLGQPLGLLRPADKTQISKPVASMQIPRLPGFEAGFPGSRDERTKVVSRHPRGPVL